MRRYSPLIALACGLFLFTACDDADSELGTLADVRVRVDVGTDGAVFDVGADGSPDEDIGPDGGDLPLDMDPDGGDLPLDMDPDGGDLPLDMGPDGGEPPIGECAPLDQPQNETCDVTPGNDAVLIRGTILAPEGEIPGGELLIDARGIIRCIACDCSDAPAAAAATVLDCGDAVVSPGLINAHEHISFAQNSPGNWGAERFEHRHDWRRGIRGHSRIRVEGRASNDEMAWGELRHLVTGTTSLVGSGGANGGLRNLDRDQEGLNQGDVGLDTFPFGDSGGELRSNNCAFPELPNNNVLREDAWSPHVAEGIDQEARNEFLCLSSADRGGRDVTSNNSAFIHMVGIMAIDGAEMAANRAAMIWSPRSNISLYGNTAPVTMLANQGVLIGLGTDWVASGSMNTAREMQCADYLSQTYFNHRFSPRDIWLMATANNAAALHVDDGVGLLQVGLVGDVAIYNRGDHVDPYRAIIEATAGTTALVLRSGEPLYGDTDIMNVMPAAQQGCEPMPGGVCGVPKQVCTQGDINRGINALANANRQAYDLYFCGVPPGEPTCVPSRPMEYNGIQDDDQDGDGIIDDEDNCPAVFNPIRPVDGMSQGDHDHDGEGDVCDVCPTTPDSDECSPPDPNDRDADGIPNLDDNCPGIFNADQLDNDEDGKGDLCDSCPAPNPGNAGCPTTIQVAKTTPDLLGQVMVVTGVVTASTESGVFIQMTEGFDPELGPQFSGIFSYLGNSPLMPAPMAAIGDHVVIEGTLNDFFSQIQISLVTRLEVLPEAAPPAEPIEVLPAQAGDGGPDGPAYEGMLITATGTVTAQNPMAGPGDQDPTNALVLNDSLWIDDLFYGIDPLPNVDDELMVTGVLRFSNGHFKLEPRDVNDVVLLNAPDPILISVTPDTVQVEIGAELSPSTPPLIARINRPAPEGGWPLMVVSANPDSLEVPGMVTVPRGEREVVIPVRGLVAEDVQIDVTSADITLSATVTVLDPNRPVLVESIGPDMTSVPVDFAAELTVTLNTIAPAPIMVTLSADPAASLMLPAEVEVPAGAQTVTFEVTGVVAGEVTVTAAYEMSEATTVVQVNDAPLLGLVISEVLYDIRGDDGGQEWVEIYNGTGAVVDLAGYSLAGAGNNYAWSRNQLGGIMQPGDCFVVGGPISNADNANPVFDFEVDFQDDLQNSGATADAVALFDVPLAQLGANTVPIDAVLYGEQNRNGLIDETGAPGEVDVGDVISGSSIERTADGWRIQMAPTPNDCTPLF